MTGLVRWAPRLLGASLLVVVVLPLFALLLTSSPQELTQAFRSPAFAPAVLVSIKTSVVSLLFVVTAGIPLAWWLSRAQGRGPAWVLATLKLPIILPPAVIGLSLLLAFGVQSTIGGVLAKIGVVLPFSAAAVVLAQVVVAAPFFVSAAALGFAQIDDDTLLMARTLGSRPGHTFTHVILPLSLPALVSGAALAWARALGEFGATLLFAGSFEGTTQTMPLAIYAALESDVGLARALALTLATFALALLALARLVLYRSSQQLPIAGGA